MGSQLQPPLEPVPGIVVRPSTNEDVQYLAHHLRKDDLNEITASTGRTPVMALGYGLVNSERCMTVEYRGKPAAMFGVVPSQTHNPRLGAVWMVGTDEIPMFTTTFLRQSKAWLDEVSRGYDVVGNFVDERNVSHVRWIKWMGFTVVARHDQYGAAKLPFLEFVKAVEENV